MWLQSTVSRDIPGGSVIDETYDILRAKRLPAVSHETIQLQLSFLKDFSKIVKVGERTYAVHKETLTKLLDKLPIQDKEINQLGEAERRILDVVLTAAIFARDQSIDRPIRIDS